MKSRSDLLFQNIACRYSKYLASLISRFETEFVNKQFGYRFFLDCLSTEISPINNGDYGEINIEADLYSFRVFPVQRWKTVKSAYIIVVFNGSLAGYIETAYEYEWVQK